MQIEQKKANEKIAYYAVFNQSCELIFQDVV